MAPHMLEREDREGVTAAFFQGNAQTYDRVVNWGTYGMDRRWKERLVAHVPTDARRILDLACGTGIVLEHLHARAPQAALVGVDFTQGYLDVALQRFEGRDLDLELIHSNAETVELSGTFDAVVSSYLPKYANANHVFEAFHDRLAPGTPVAFHDFAYPHAFARVVWRVHMAFLKHVGRRLLPSWRACFEENLESLIQHSGWQHSYKATFERFGYTDVRLEVLNFRTAYLVSGRRGTRTAAQARALIGG